MPRRMTRLGLVGGSRVLMGLLFGAVLLQPGCALYRGAKAVVSPVGAATGLIVESSKAAASVAGTVGTTTSSTVAGDVFR